MNKESYIKIMSTIRFLLFLQLVFIYIPYLVIHFSFFDVYYEEVKVAATAAADGASIPIDIVIDASQCEFKNENDNWQGLQNILGGKINFMQTRFKNSISNIVGKNQFGKNQFVDTAYYVDERLVGLPTDIDIEDLKH